MGFLVQATRSKIFKEFDSEKQKEFFSITRNKVLPGVDTLYFSVSLHDDIKDLKNNNIEQFLYILNSYKNLDHDEELWFDFDNELIYKDISFGFYRHCISRNKMFDIFICNKLPNDKTPRIVVQIRSNMLWCFGERYSINYIYNLLSNLLYSYNIRIKEIKENRIDFCYHTNSLQNFDTYFSDEYIREHLETSFQIGNKVFRKDKNTLNIEYLSLGNRKSNNLFFRTYNKTLEVVEMAYKDFFLDIWLAYGLISKYDYYILTYCYEHQNFNKQYEAKIKFYIENGLDSELKNKCNTILSDETITLDSLRLFTKGLCPDVTKVQNFEFQTMRKFYYHGSELIDTLPIIEECDSILLRLFQILDNRKLFLDYLTSKVVNFKDIKNNKSSDFWIRIQSCKLDNTVQIPYKRKYSNDKNINLVLNKLKSNLATYSIYKGNENTDILTDMCNLINTVNDNDINELERYNIIKNKKAKAQKSINTLKTLADD